MISKQIFNSFFTEDSTWNLVKIGLVCDFRRKYIQILHDCIYVYSPGARLTHRDKYFYFSWKMLLFLSYIVRFNHNYAINTSKRFNIFPIQMYRNTNLTCGGKVKSHSRIIILSNLTLRLRRCYIQIFSLKAFLKKTKTIVDAPSTGSLKWNLVKTGQAVSKVKTFKYYTILYMYISQGLGQRITLRTKFWL